MGPGFAGALTAASLISFASQALAFCRTTTCDLQDPKAMCSTGPDSCVLSGLPLFWEDRCVTFSVQADGSARRGISAAQTAKVAEAAFGNWLGSRCGSGLPSIGVLQFPDVYCGIPEFNYAPPAPNANVIMFRDSSWPYVGGTNSIALTTITFDSDTGQIFDADIELNSFAANLTITDDPNLVDTDLQSVLTHEIGHLFGLAHNDNDKGASMQSRYNPKDFNFRTPNADDQAGLCSIYPPDPDFDHEVCPVGTQPRHGFGRVCSSTLVVQSGCSVTSVTSARRSLDPRVAIPALLGMIGVGWRRRRRTTARAR